MACIFHDRFSQIGWGTFCHQALSASRFCPVAEQGWTSTPLGFGDSIWNNHVAQHIPSQIRYASNDTCQLPNAISLWGWLLMLLESIRRLSSPLRERNPSHVGMPGYARRLSPQPPAPHLWNTLRAARDVAAEPQSWSSIFLRNFGAQSVTKPCKIRQVLQEFHTKSQLPGQVPWNHVDRKGIEHLYFSPRNRTASSFSLDINFSYAASSSKPGPPKGSNKAFPVLVKVSFLTGAAWSSCMLLEKHMGLHGVGSWLETEAVMSFQRYTHLLTPM